MNRRSLLSCAVLMAFAPKAGAAAETVEIETFDANGRSLGPSRVEKIVKSEVEWRAQLSPLAFEVTRQDGTERAFTGPYWDNHADGLYRCVGCDTALYDSKTKFDSGTGWPSYWKPEAKEYIKSVADNSYGMRRIEVMCARCDAHLGHVFDDGPPPTGLRYCINSVSLKFVKEGE